MAESVNRQHQTPQRGDRSLGLATADKEESAELHSPKRNVETSFSASAGWVSPIQSFNGVFKHVPMQRKHRGKAIKVIALSLILTIAPSTSSMAEPPPLPEDLFNLGPLENLFKFGVRCEGKTDLPHISRHRPGTVNVQARTSCAGKGVEITTRLTRSYMGTKLSVTKSNQGTGRTTINASLKCIWKKGAKKIRYEVSSVHRLSDGQIGYTYNFAELDC